MELVSDVRHPKGAWSMPALICCCVAGPMKQFGLEAGCRGAAGTVEKLCLHSFAKQMEKRVLAQHPASPRGHHSALTHSETQQKRFA